jgi:hypothetical protein
MIRVTSITRYSRALGLSSIFLLIFSFIRGHSRKSFEPSHKYKVKNIFYDEIITGELASSDIVWNTSLSFTTSPFKNDRLRLAFIATNIKARFTELKVFTLDLLIGCIGQSLLSQILSRIPSFRCRR